MIIALQKKKDNIAEYLLYMWQVEDLLRACQFDETLIEERLVKRFSAMTNDLTEVRTWYLELRDMLLTEGKRTEGHIQLLNNLLTELADLHQRLLATHADAIYTSCYYATLPHIVALRAKSGSHLSGEIETCFNALYGLWLMRLQNTPIGDETRLAMQQISKFTALLALKYKEEKEGKEE